MKARDAFGLLFEWPSRHALQPGLALGLLAAALLHVAGLGLFSLRETAPPRPSLRPAAVAFLPEGHPAAVVLSARAAMADPSIFAGARLEEPLETRIAPPAYRPSFEGWVPVPAPAPPFSVGAPEGVLTRGPLEIRTPGPAPACAPGPPTRVTLEGGLAGAVFELPGESAFVPGLRVPPAPSEWLVAVGEDGRVAHDFLLRSSGDDQLDRAARRALRDGRVRPAPEGVRWGFAVFNWGGDLGVEEAR